MTAPADPLAESYLRDLQALPPAGKRELARRLEERAAHRANPVLGGMARAVRQMAVEQEARS